MKRPAKRIQRTNANKASDKAALVECDRANYPECPGYREREIIAAIKTLRSRAGAEVQEQTKHLKHQLKKRKHCRAAARFLLKADLRSIIADETAAAAAAHAPDASS